VPALQQAIDAVFDARVGDISGRGKLGADMREIWMMQPRLERRQTNTALAMIEQPRFRAGFDFLRLRADVGEVPTELAEWWEDFSLGNDDEREALLAAAREAQRTAPKRVPAPGRSGAARGAPRSAEAPATDADADSGTDEQASDEPADDAPADATAPRKRRRRRRKPSGGGGGGAPESGATAAT
jgi:poly(A) polymerase